MAFDKIKAGLNKVMEMTHLGQNPSAATDEQEMARLRLLVEELTKKCATQAKDIEKLEQNNDRLEGQNKQLEGQNKQLEDETKQLRSKTQQLSEALIHEKSLVADLNKKLGAFIDIVKEARDTVLKYMPQGVSSYGLDDVELDHEGIKRLVYSLANMAIEYVRKRQIIDGLQHNFFGSKSERLHYSHDQSGNPSGQEPTFAGSDNGSEQTHSANDDETIVTDTTETATQDGVKPEVHSVAGTTQREKEPEAKPGNGVMPGEGKAEEQPSEAGAKAAEGEASKSEGAKSEAPENNKANELKETIESVNELQETVSQRNKGVNTLVDNAHSAIGNQETEELLQEKQKKCEKITSKEEKNKITKVMEALGSVNRLMSKITRLCEDEPKENKPSPGRQVNPHLKGKGKHVSVNSDLNSLLKEMQKLDPNCIPEKCIDPVTGNVYEGHAFTLISNARNAVVSTFKTMIANVKLYEGSVPLWICGQCGAPVVPYPNPQITGITEHGNHLSITVLCRGWAQYAFAIPLDRLLRFTEEKYGLGHDTIQYGMDLLADLVIMAIFILMESESKKKLSYAIVDGTPLQSLENKCQGNSHSLDAMVKKDPTIEGHYFVDADKETSSKKGSKSRQSDKSETVPATDSAAKDSNNEQKSQTERKTEEGSTVTLTSEEAESIESVVKKSIKTLMGTCGEGESDFLFDTATFANSFADEINEMKTFDELYADDADDDQDGEKKRKPCAGYVLAITSHPADEFQVVLFKAMAGRSSEKIAHALDGFNFYGLMRDGYSGYIKVEGNIVRWVPMSNNPNENEPNVQVCGIHFRRPIFELLRSSGLSKELDKLSDKDQKQYFWDNLIKIKQMANGEPHVTIGYIQILSVVMLLFQLIYRVEKLVPIDDPDYFKKIAEKRSNLSAPLWDCICQLMDILVDMHCTVDPKTHERKVDQRFPTHKVLSYWLTNKDRLSRFLSDPHLRFDTLDVERTIRPITLLRKNINYFTSEEGRQRYCQWMSIVETLRLYGVDDVEQYLIEATRYMVWHARQKMLPELLEKLRENPKYFNGERNPLYMKNIRNYVSDIDWTPFLPWNVGTNAFTKDLKSNNSKRRFFEAARRLTSS